MELYQTNMPGKMPYLLTRQFCLDTKMCSVKEYCVRPDKPINIQSDQK